MGDSETVKNDSSSNRRLGTLVGGYVRRRLHRGVHPAFDALRSEENAADDPSDVAQEIEKKDGTEVCIVGTHGVEPPGDESEIDDPLYGYYPLSCAEKEYSNHAQKRPGYGGHARTRAIPDRCASL